MINHRNTACHGRFLSSLLIVLLAFSLLIPTSASADDQIVTVGVYENPPKIFTSESGQPAGIFIDILEHIAKLEGWRLRYVPGTWAEGLDRLEKGEIDLMPDVAYSADRAKIFSFHTVPVLSSWFQVYAPKGSKIQSILDLNEKKILVLDRSVQEDAFIRLGKGFGLNFTLISVPDYKTMFEMTARGEADAVITNRFYGVMNAKKFGLEDTAVVFEPSDLFFAASKGVISNPSDLFFTAPKKDPKLLLAAIDRHLLDLKKDSQSLYYGSLKRWASEEVQFKLPAWLQILGLVAGLALLMSLVGSFVLKHQVNARTRELQQINQGMEQRINERTAELKAINVEQRTIFESANIGIVLMRDLVILNCNRKLEEIFGYASGELVGKSTRVWYPNEAAYAIGGSLAYTQMARGETQRREQQLVRKDGTLFWARMSGKAFDKNNPSKGAVGIIEDITDEREAAEKLRKALEKAKAADRIKSAFLATMSHELRTPLNSIIGFTGIMLQGLTGPLSQEQQKQMTMVQGSSRHLLALINDVLDISKIEAGQLEFSITSFELKPSIEKMAALVSPLAQKKGIDLRLDIADDIETITTDQRRLEQIILNLLNNAVKFTKKGHVCLSCRMEKDHCVLSISDTGIGMRPEELPKLFQPFHQIDTGTTRKHEGSGLGLSICKKLLDMMSGTINVESRWGQGSAFTVRIPKG